MSENQGAECRDNVHKLRTVSLMLISAAMIVIAFCTDLGMTPLLALKIIPRAADILCLPVVGITSFRLFIRKNKGGRT